MRTWIGILTLAVAGCSAATPSPTDTTAPRLADPEAPVAPLPRVELLTLENQAARIDAVASGKVALVSFWATWCDACAREFDALNRLDERTRTGGGVVIGVAVGEPREKAADFARAHNLRYRQLVDEEFKLTDALGQRRIPATLVVDRSGRVVFSGGALDERALAAFRGALGGG